MALLGKIRKNSWLLIVVIGLAMIAFLLDPKTLSNLGKNPNIIGKVNGEKITRQEYLEQIEFYRQLSPNIPENYLFSLIWESILNEKVLDQQAKKLGVEISENDFWDAIGKRSIYTNIEQLQDKKGNFDRKKFTDYLNELKKHAKTNPQAQKEYKLWTYQKENMLKKLRSDQYTEMIFACSTTDKNPAKDLSQAKNVSTTIDYIFIPYQNYQTRYSISVKDEEIKKYIKSHSSLYKRPRSRNLSVVFFPGKPSKGDIDKAEQEVQNLVKDLKNTDENEAFISTHSEIPYDPNYYSEEHFQDSLKKFLKNAKKGQVYGPIKELNAYVAFKLTDKKVVSQSTKSSHILISYKGALRSKATRSKEEAKKMAEDTLATIKSNSSQFQALAEKSDDPSAKINKGNLGWTKHNESNFIPEFQKYIVEQPKGKIGIVETKFGYHIVKIDDKSPPVPSYQVATLQKSLRPSKETENSLYANASKFMEDVSKVGTNVFIHTARKSGHQPLLLKEILPSQPFIQELQTDSDSKIIRWSFETERKKGDTKMFSTSSGDYIVARVSGIQEEGLASLEDVKEEITFLLKKEKLAAILSEKVKKIKASTLEHIAGSLEEKITKNVHVKLSDSQIEGVGLEPKVVGTATGIELKKPSQPIKGNKGLFVIYALERNQDTKSYDHSEKIDKQKNSYNNKVSLAELLKTKFEIKDYRGQEITLNEP